MSVPRKSDSSQPARPVDETTATAMIRAGVRRLSPRFGNISLRTKLTFLVIGSCVFTLLFPTIVYILHERELAKRELAEELTVLSNMLAYSAQLSITNGRTSELSKLLEHLVVEPNILLGEIRTDPGPPAARFIRDPGDSVYLCAQAASTGVTFHKHHAHMRAEIVRRGVSLGYVHLLIDLEELDERLDHRTITMALVAVVSLAMSFMVSLRLQRLITRPILELSSLAERVSEENDLSLRATYRSNDEVGSLVKGFNTMLTRVQLTADALQESRKTLEQRVRQRTMELEREVSERRVREAELRESRTRLQEEKNERHRLAVAVEQSPEGILIAEANGAIEFVNHAFEDMFEVRRDQLMHKSAEILRSDLHTDDYYESLYDSVSTGRVWTDDFHRRRHDGRVQVFHVTISPIRDEDQVISNFVAVCIDVTHELEMETQLRQSQKLEAVGSLAAGIAHEINTPIQFVGDNLQFMSTSFDDLMKLIHGARELIESRADANDDNAAAVFHDLAQSVELDFLEDEMPRAIAQARDGVKRVATIVQAMKRFSHPDMSQTKSLANINEALSNTLTVARNELKYVSDVELELDPDLPMVNCLQGELNQVFLNLLINAAHAVAEQLEHSCDAKGTITVRTYRQGDDIIIEFADTGRGIPPDIQDRIFDPFFTTKGVGKGTGQGLAIARSVIVDKHGGEIRFRSELGKGTTFYIRLPIDEPTGEATPQSRRAAVLEG